MVTYDFAFCTKYRYDVLTPEIVVTRTRELIAEVAANNGGSVEETPRVDTDFVYARLSVPESKAPKDVLNSLKGWLSVYLQKEYSAIRARYYGKPMFDRSFFRISNGPATTEELDDWKAQFAKY
jgi:REP element-mobilizing transposase RayT